MVGRRIELSDFYDDDTRQAGDYCKVERKAHHGEHLGFSWYVCDPLGMVGRLDDHTVTEHEDGTITVEPSILNAEEGGYHGHLVAGVWNP